VLVDHHHFAGGIGMKKVNLVTGILTLITSSSVFSAPLVSLHMNTVSLWTDSAIVISLLGTLTGIMAIRVYRNKLRNR